MSKASRCRIRHACPTARFGCWIPARAFWAGSISTTGNSCRTCFARASCAAWRSREIFAVGLSKPRYLRGPRPPEESRGERQRGLVRRADRRPESGSVVEWVRLDGPVSALRRRLPRRVKCPMALGQQSPENLSLVSIEAGASKAAAGTSLRPGRVTGGGLRAVAYSAQQCHGGGHGARRVRRLGGQPARIRCGLAPWLWRAKRILALACVALRHKSVVAASSKRLSLVAALSDLRLAAPVLAGGRNLEYSCPDNSARG